MANRNNTFLIKRSNVPGKIPSSGDLLLGELALNTADAILYASGTTANSILPIGWDRVSRTGDTISGTLYVTTISATTYQNLPKDVFVTGGTYSSSSSTIIFTNNTGGTFSVTGAGTSITSFTYLDNNLTINQSNGSGLTANISVMTGLTVNGNLTTLNLLTDYLYDSTNSYGFPGQILVSTPTGIQWVSGDFCELSNTTTSGLEVKTIDTITGFTSGSYIVKSYLTAYSGTSKYGFWERTLGVVTSGGTPISSIITQNFDNYSNGFLPSQIVYSSTTANTINIIISGLTGENLYWESYYDIVGQSCRPVVNVLPSSNLGAFGLTIGNGVNVITTGQKGFVKMPYPGTITDWTILSDLSGSIVIDIWKDSYVNFPPTSADTITNGYYPYLSGQTINTDNVLSGWTKDFLVNDVFVFNVLSADTVTNINLTINVIKT